MKIKSKLNGEVSNVRGDIAREMVKLGVAEIIDANEVDFPKSGDAIITEPEWDVVTIKGMERETLVIRMTRGQTTVLYGGRPEDVNHKITWPGGFRWASGFGVECPSETCKLYKKMWSANESLRAPGVGVQPPGESNEYQAAELKGRGGRFVPLREK